MLSGGPRPKRKRSKITSEMQGLPWRGQSLRGGEPRAEARPAPCSGRVGDKVEASTRTRGTAQRPGGRCLSHCNKDTTRNLRPPNCGGRDTGDPIRAMNRESEGTPNSAQRQPKCTPALLNYMRTDPKSLSRVLGGTYGIWHAHT